MKILNYNLYQMVEGLTSLSNDNKIYIPAKANFFIQKNISILAAAAQEIEKARLDIAQHYGEMSEETGSYKIPEDKMEIVQKELNDLFNIEQEIDIKKIKIEDLGDAQFTSSQMQTLMIMIDDE
jgi:parvulin-like peptidyl-prolyl isomerase